MEEDMKDKWRYTYLPEWALDNLSVPHNPEDSYIDALDGTTEKEYPFDGYEILSKLSAKEAKVVESILYDGLTFEATGKAMRLSKQRIHQIYTGALTKLKGELTNGKT
jgi:DNA-directed RNA polymerase sigma subunit (sigma70/sigma32)